MASPRARIAESLRRPYPHALPTLALATLVPMYMAIAVLTRGRTVFVPELPLDRALPVQPAWVVVYWSQWVFSFLPVFVVRGVELRRRAVLAYLAVVVAYFGFLLYPTLGPRPAEVVGGDFFAWGLRFVYAADPPYNCFPSLHVGYAFLAALTTLRVHRGLGVATLVWATLVGLSTLFTKQHYVLDVVAGAVGALAADRVFLHGVPRDAVAAAARRRAPARALVVVWVFAILLAALWARYRSGMVPG